MKALKGARKVEKAKQIESTADCKNGLLGKINSGPLVEEFTKSRLLVTSLTLLDWSISNIMNKIQT